jgi:hypothetical protein
MLTRSAFILIGVFTVFYMAFVAYRTERSTRRIVRSVAAVAVGSMVLVVPWMIRNYRTWDVWMMESKIGVNLNTGFHDLADGTPDGEAFAPVVRQDETLRALNEVERDRVHRDTALAWIRTHPAQTLALMAKKAALFWNPVPRQGEGLLFFVALTWSSALIGATLFGLVLSLRTFPTQLYLYGALVMYIVPHLLAYVMTRYRIPVEGLFAVFAAQAVAAVTTRLGWHNRTRHIAP